jgi:hypothetical protein
MVAASAREAMPAEAIPADTARATNTARIIAFIGTLHLQSGEMFGFDIRQIRANGRMKMPHSSN